jgi:hypothetical protein
LPGGSLPPGMVNARGLLLLAALLLFGLLLAGL